MIRLLKQTVERTEGRSIRAGQVVAACLYGLAFALFVCWRRFAG